MTEQTKSTLPSIDAELTGRPRHRLPHVPSRSVELEDSTVEANTTQLGRRWDAVETVRSSGEEAPAKPETIWESIRLNIPSYLNKCLSRNAVEKDCTKTHLILQALAKAGYEIDPSDMMPDRRMKK